MYNEKYNCFTLWSELNILHSFILCLSFCEVFFVFCFLSVCFFVLFVFFRIKTIRAGYCGDILTKGIRHEPQQKSSEELQHIQALLQNVRPRLKHCTLAVSCQTQKHKLFETNVCVKFHSATSLKKKLCHYIYHLHYQTICELCFYVQAEVTTASDFYFLNCHMQRLLIYCPSIIYSLI